MLAAMLAVFLTQASPAVSAGYLCSEFDHRGDYDAGKACRADEMDREREAGTQADRERLDRSMRQQERAATDVLRELQLDDRLRELAARRAPADAAPRLVLPDIQNRDAEAVERKQQARQRLDDLMRDLGR